MKKAKTSVTLDMDLIEQIKAEAKRERRSVSQLIEIWIRDALAVLKELEAEQTGNNQ